MSNWEIGFILAGYLLAGVGFAGVILQDKNWVETGPKWFAIVTMWPLLGLVYGLIELGHIVFYFAVTFWIWLWER